MLNQALHFPLASESGVYCLVDREPVAGATLATGAPSPCFTHCLPFHPVISSNWCVSLARFFRYVYIYGYMFVWGGVSILSAHRSASFILTNAM